MHLLLFKSRVDLGLITYLTSHHGSSAVMGDFSCASASPLRPVTALKELYYVEADAYIRQGWVPGEPRTLVCWTVEHLDTATVVASLL